MSSRSPHSFQNMTRVILTSLGSNQSLASRGLWIPHRRQEIFPPGESTSVVTRPGSFVNQH
ncbi:hypothetical protein YC2023_020739 [Brassica napus]